MTLKFDSISRQEFFLVTPINFEVWAKKEIEEKFPQLDTNLEKGGVTVNCLLDEGFLLNHYLKIPTKILLRIGTFKAKDFPKFYQEILKLPFRQFLRDKIPEIEVSVSKCRLIHSKRLEEVTIDALKKFNEMYPPKKAPTDAVNEEASLLIRGFDDQFTISINTSGTSLYKRGNKEFTGLAPLRENFAAGLLYLSKNVINEDIGIYDIFTGSGTFLSESIHFYASTDRNFSYQNFPCARKLKISKNSKLQTLFSMHEGIDQNPKNIEQTQKLLEGKLIIEKNDVFQVKDFKNSFIIGNPPYGKRIPLKNPLKFYQGLINYLLESNGKYIGLIIPDEFIKYLDIKKPIYTLPFNNGGIKVSYVILKK